jgi:hypothetical protein
MTIKYDFVSCVPISTCTNTNAILRVYRSVVQYCTKCQTQWYSTVLALVLVQVLYCTEAEHVQ